LTTETTPLVSNNYNYSNNTPCNYFNLKFSTLIPLFGDVTNYVVQTLLNKELKNVELEENSLNESKDSLERTVYNKQTEELARRKIDVLNAKGDYHRVAFIRSAALLAVVGILYLTNTVTFFVMVSLVLLVFNLTYVHAGLANENFKKAAKLDKELEMQKLNSV